MNDQGDMFGGLGRRLADARERVMKGRWESGGVICECCDGIAKVRKRHLNSTLAKHLIYLWRWDLTEPGEYHHVKNRLAKLGKTWFNGEYARLADYGLIEKADGARPDGNPDNGHYRITEHGKDFVTGKVTVPKWGYYYKGRVLEWSQQGVTLEEALGQPFDYIEVWSRINRNDDRTHV